MMNSGHTLNIKFPCNLGISCNNSINLNSCFSEFLFLFSTKTNIDSLFTEKKVCEQLYPVLLTIDIDYRSDGTLPGHTKSYFA